MIQLDDACDILGSFVSEEVDGEFEALFVLGIFEGDGLIEDVPVIGAGRGFPGE